MPNQNEPIPEAGSKPAALSVPPAKGLMVLLIPILPILIGLTGLIGWQFDLHQFKSILPGAVEMKANTAIGLIFSGTGLLIFIRKSLTRFKPAGLILALTVSLLGLATLLQYLLGWNLGIDEWLFRDSADAFNRIPGRMSPYTAGCFIMIGLSLMAMSWKPDHPLITAQALIVVIIGSISFLGYLWNATELITDQWAPPVAIHTAVALTLLGIGLLQINLKWVFGPVAKAPMQAVEKKILAGFVFALLVLTLFGGYTYRSGVQFSKSSQWVEHTQQVRIAIQRVYSTLSNLETSQLTYLLSGDEEQFNYYSALLIKIDDQQQSLNKLVSDNPEQLRNLQKLQRLITEKRDRMAAAVQIYRKEGSTAVNQFISGGQGIETTIAIRDLVEEIGNIEEKLLRKRQAAQSQQGTVTLVSLLLTLTVAAILLISLYRGIQREIKARAETEAKLVSANRFLDSIFENIPSMIFIKEAKELRYVQLNRAGETLLGVSRQELIGKNDYDFYPKEKAEALFTRDREVLNGDQIANVDEEKFYVRSKGNRLFHTIRIPLRDEKGNAIFLLGLTEDITERREAEKKIIALNLKLTERAEEIEASNKELESFSYSISHDLRAPLRHVQGYVQMLLDDCGSTLPSEPRRYLDVIAKSSEQMGKLIDNLLDFSRMSRTVLRKEATNLDLIIQESIDGLEMQTRNRRIEWRINPVPNVIGDHILLKQVLVNLISNALKYSAPRDPAIIEIGIEEQNGPWVTLFVKDNGVGFEMQYASKLFGVFQRLHRADEFEGTGIGLANVQRIINRHGGRVWAEAELNRGACFYFTLKMA